MLNMRHTYESVKLRESGIADFLYKDFKGDYKWWMTDENV